MKEVSIEQIKKMSRRMDQVLKEEFPEETDGVPYILILDGEKGGQLVTNVAHLRLLLILTHVLRAGLDTSQVEIVEVEDEEAHH